MTTGELVGWAVAALFGLVLCHTLLRSAVSSGVLDALERHERKQQ